MSHSLDIEGWRRAEVLFEAALDWPEPERATFLERACAGDDHLQEAVASLLHRDSGDTSFLETPLFQPQSLESSPGPENQWVGRRLGVYQVAQPIGAGGMGCVYLGERVDGEVEQQVAIKVLREEAESSYLLRALRRERQILADLDHPNIARYLDGGTTPGGRPYLVMEYLDGPTLVQFCDAARLDVSQRLELFRKVCDAVDHAHRHLVVHGDLKPSNILVTEAGEPKLLDFGIAELLDASKSEPGAPEAIGRFFTPSYASPEQCAGEPASTASDVYSLGVLLFQLLTGLRPRDLSVISIGANDRPRTVDRPSTAIAPSAAAVASRGPEDDRTLEPPEFRAEVRNATPRQLRRRLAGDLDHIVQRCLHRRPADRYRSVGELAEDVHRHLHRLPVVARSPRWSYRLGRFVVRHPLGVALSSLALLALAGLGLGIVQQSRVVAEERDRAQESSAEAEEVTSFLTEAIELSDPFYRSDSDLNPGDRVTVNEVLDFSAEKIRRRFTDRPTLQARLMATIGTVYGSLARTDEAEALHRDALAIRYRHAAERPGELIDSLNGLVFILVDTGRLSEAAPLAEEAVARSRRLEPEDGVRLAESLTNSAMLDYFGGDLVVAEDGLREALSLRAAWLPPDAEDQILNRTYLARVLSQRGKLDEAESFVREALEICLRAERRDHVRLSTVFGDLAWLLTEKGDHAGAEPYYRQALEILESKFESGHPSVIEARGGLGLFLREKGDLAGAEEALRANLAERRANAETQPTGLAITLNNLGLVFADAGRPKEAEPLFREALTIATSNGGDSRRSLPSVLRNLADVLRAMGKPALAEPLLRDAADLLRDGVGSDSPRFANALTSLAAVLVDLERFDEALDLGRQAEGILVAALPAGHRRIALARGAIGAALTGLGQFEEAEPLLLQGLEDLRRTTARHPRAVRAARLRLVQLYDAWGRPADADRHRRPDDLQVGASSAVGTE
ncbi:MAG: serine/threonine-protein kinase [Thermoanaerobaculia bacterium]|nr:serine/threonine-protein kinase [Thermoanaerobaculia bacterium]